MLSLRCLCRPFGLLFGLVALSTPLTARAADSPFAGKWKLLVPQRYEEVSLWIIQIDSEARSVKMLAGLGQFDTATISDVKATPKLLLLRLKQGTSRFEVSITAGAAANKRLRGSIRVGSTILPCWLAPTDQTKLDDKKAIQSAAGQAELQETRKQTDTSQRHKAIRAIAAKYPGDLTPFLAQQMLLAELLRDKAPASALATVIADYRKLAAAHGDDMLLGANLDLARHLLPYPPAADLCADCARAAIKLFRPEHPTELKISARLTLANALILAGKKDETKPVVEDLAKLAVAFNMAFGTNDDTKFLAALNTAKALLSSPADPVSELGLVYARKAVESLKSTATPQQRLAAYQALLKGVQKHGKPDEIAKTQALVDFIEVQLDETFRKEAVPFKVDAAVGRKSKSTRVVLVELFTTAEALPCIAADIAFDAARKAYRTTDVVFLRYHVHVNAPDILTSPAALARREFYRADIEETIPAALVDGQMTPALGGSVARARANFEILKKAIDSAREKPAEGKIILEGQPVGGKFTVRAAVSSLSEIGDKVRLRFVVVEEEARHAGHSGRRLHGQVVRGFLGDRAGIKLGKKDSIHTETLDVAALRKSLDTYRAAYARQVNHRWDNPPPALGKLAIIVFVQHEETKKVYQAARIDVPATK